MCEVTGKIALVFGAIGGIGRCTVQKLLDNDVKGVVLADLQEGTGALDYMKELESIYEANKVAFVKVDVSKLDEIKDAFKETIKTFGNLDIVINCVGVTIPDFNINITINLIGTTHIVNEAYNYLPQHKSPTSEQGVILNLSSMSGLCPLVLIPSYCVSKTGIITLGYCMGKLKEMSGDNTVRIMTLCPAATATPMTKNSANMADVASGGVKRMIEYVFDEKHIQKPESVAKCILQMIRNGENASLWVSRLNNDAELIDYEAILKFVREILQFNYEA